jgi:hypothetical protein
MTLAYVALHVFDMDGTLLAGTSASLQISGYLGCAEDLAELGTQLLAGEIDSPGFVVVVHRLWKNLTRRTILFTNRLGAPHLVTGLLDSWPKYVFLFFLIAVIAGTIAIWNRSRYHP